MSGMNRLSGWRWMGRVAGAMTCVLAAVPLSGCLLKDVSELWYVDASGAVTWVVQETNVRSDANAAIDRHNEESVYWLAVQQERHPMAGGHAANSAGRRSGRSSCVARCPTRCGPRRASRDSTNWASG